MAILSRRSALKLFATALGTAVPALLHGAEPPFTGQGSGLKFELYRDGRRRFRWRLKAANGRILATSSEGYNAKADCRIAIDRIREGASTAAVDDVTS